MTYRQHACILTYATVVSICGVRAADSLPPAPQSDAKAFIVSIEIYRAQTDDLICRAQMGDLDKTTLRVAGSASKSTTQGDAYVGANSGAKGYYSLSFREADIAAKGFALHATPEGWTWNGKPEPPAGTAVEKIAAPKICALAGQQFQVWIGSEIPIQYFEKRPDGLFALKELKEWTGVKIRGAVDSGGDGEALIRDLTIEVRTVGARAPLEGVTLDVGSPIVAARELATTIKVPHDRYSGVIFDSEAHGFLLLKVKVSAAPPAEKRDGAAPPSPPVR